LGFKVGDSNLFLYLLCFRWTKKKINKKNPRAA
jgi:hypothetical protein